MPGIIGTNKTRQKQIFRQLSPPVQSTATPTGHEQFFPWRAPVRDAAPTPNTIGAAHAQQNATFQKILGMCADVGARISALEMKKAARQQLAEQQQIVNQRSAQTQYEKPPSTLTQDRAPCACQHVLMPQRANTHDGVNVMLRNPQLAPRAHVTFDPVSRSTPTRDQNRLDNYLEQPSRFTSAEADRMARHIVGAGPPTQKELNDAYAAHWARDAGAAPLGAPGVNKRGGMVEAVSSDPSEAFLGPGGPFTQFRNDDVRPSPAALGELNRQFSKAKTQGQRDAITDAWKSYMSAPRDAASMASQWKPKQPAISASQAPKRDDTHDAPWSNLYEQNKGVIGGDPNKIQVGQSLNLPGGGTHVVQSGETLSGIASTPAGTDLGQRSLSAERGGMESTPAPSGSYSSGGSLSSGEGAPAGAPGAHNAANVPVPPVKPDLSEGSSSSSSSSGETPTPPVKPASLGGTGESPEGLNPQAGEGGGASPTGSEGTGLAKMVRGWVTGETE
jgi:LysM repeat protein